MAALRRIMLRNLLITAAVAAAAQHVGGACGQDSLQAQAACKASAQPPPEQQSRHARQMQQGPRKANCRHSCSPSAPGNQHAACQPQAEYTCHCRSQAGACCKSSLLPLQQQPAQRGTCLGSCGLLPGAVPALACAGTGKLRSWLQCRQLCRPAVAGPCELNSR